MSTQLVLTIFRKLFLLFSTISFLLSSSLASANLTSAAVIIYVNPGEDIQIVVDSIPDASALNPYEIVLLPGTHVVDNPITLNNYIHLSGSGKNTTKLKPAASVPILRFEHTKGRIYIQNMELQSDVCSTIVDAKNDSSKHEITFNNVTLLQSSECGFFGGMIIKSSKNWDIRFENCYTESVKDAFWLSPQSGNDINLEFINHQHHAKFYVNSNSGIFVSIKKPNVKVLVFNSIIDGQGDGNYGPVAFKVTTQGQLRIYNTRIDLQNTVFPKRARGIDTHPLATGADIEMYGGSIETHGGYDVRNRVDALGTGFKLYGVNYSTSKGDFEACLL